jgi:hypothetical protein
MNVPQNEYAEDNFLGLLIRGEISPSQAAEKGITEAHFIVRQGLFTAISEFIESGGELHSDFIMQLHAQGTLDQLGTAALINQIATHEGHFKSLASYVNHLRTDYGKRLLMQGGQSLAINPENTEAMAQVIAGKAEIELANNRSLASIIIQARAFDVHNRPPSPPPMVKLENNCLFTAGNLSAIIADRKAGKSSALTGILAALMAGTNHKDLLGFTAINPLGRAVVHFDTEQSPADHYDLVMRVLQRAGITEPPSWFSSYSLTGLSLPEKKQFITTALDYAARDNDGIQMAIIDGIADICHDPNNAIESFDLVENWHNYAVNQDCVVLGVLHLNPGTDKSRGHLGSQLERKAETPLRIEKDGTTGVSTMYATHARHCHIARNHGYCFEYSKDHGMHITTTKEKRDEVKDTIKRNAAADKANEIMAGKPPMTHSDLVKAIMKKNDVKDRQAKGTITTWKNLEVIKQSESGKYELQN